MKRRTVSTSSLITGLCLLLLYWTPSGASDQRDKVVLPHIEARTSTTIAGQGESRAMPISATEVIWINVFGQNISIGMASYDNRVWGYRNLTSFICDCSWYIKTTSQDYVVLNLYDREVNAYSNWILSRADTGKWIVTREPADSLSNEFWLQDSVIKVNGDQQQYSISILEKTTGLWQSFDSSFLPPAFARFTEPSGWSFFPKLSTGSSTDFVTLTQRPDEIINYTLDSAGQWLELPVPVPVDSAYFGVHSIELKGDTLMLMSLNADYELPNQGATYFYRREAGKWQLESTVYSSEKSGESSAELLNERTARIDNTRIYERGDAGDWEPVSVINTGSEVHYSFLQDGLLSFADSVNLNISDWMSRPTCSGVDSNGAGLLLDSACTLKEVSLSAPSSVGLMSRFASGKPAPTAMMPVVASDTIQFLDVEYGLYTGELYAYSFNKESKLIERELVALCALLSITDSDCAQTSVWGAGVNESALVEVGFSRDLYSVLRNEDGSWDIQSVELPMTSGQNGTVYSRAVKENRAVIFSYTSALVLKRDTGHWYLDYVADFSKLRPEGTFEVSLSEQFIALSDEGAKTHLFFEAEQNLWYEETLSLGYTSNDMKGNTVVVGKPFDGSVGHVKLLIRVATGDWSERQKISGDPQVDEYFGQQVLIANDLLVVMSLRSVDVYNYEPDYHVYRKQPSGEYALIERVQHTSNRPKNCLDCLFPQDIKWSARLIENHLFLPVFNDVPVSDSASGVGNYTVSYEVFNYSLQPGSLAESGALDDNQGVCIDSDGDGWGWNGSASCLLDSSLYPECRDADSDIDGDGWGWENNLSCRIVAYECIDTDGDGWGWDGEKSCRLDEPAVVAEECIDSDGDGWGWDGTASCSVGQ